MKDTKEFESLLEKSRKLQALIADGSGATEGERQAALAALDRLLARYRLSPDALAVLLSARRAMHWLLLAPHPSATVWPEMRWKARHEEALLSLAAHCFWFVAGTQLHERNPDFEWKVFNTTKRSARSKVGPKTVQLRNLGAMMTDIEFEEWRSCFYHYAPDFIRGLETVRKAARVAARAVKVFPGSFVNVHELFGPDSVPSTKPLTTDQVNAMRSAARHVTGEGWNKSTAALGGSFLLEN
jgi:hypothetical protein